MNISLGFILLTHTKPHQIHRLIAKLNGMFNYPQIVCHHDFSKCDLSLNICPKNVTFIRPHLQTGWAEFSVVEATVRALELMYKAPNPPDWFVLLSGADYPIKSADQILLDLRSSPYDVHMHHEQINYNAYERDWQELCHERYCTIKFGVPFLNRKLRLTKRTVTLRHPLLTDPFLPFSNTLHCFAGSQWFCANHKAAEYIIQFHSNRTALASHYRTLMFSEESYFQTILCNAPHLRLQNNDWRYIEWYEGSSPKILVTEDLPKLLASSAHFARKFDIDIDSIVLDELDAVLG